MIFHLNWRAVKYAESGTGLKRKYLHTYDDATPYKIGNRVDYDSIGQKIIGKVKRQFNQRSILSKQVRNHIF